MYTESTIMLPGESWVGAGFCMENMSVVGLTIYDSVCNFNKISVTVVPGITCTYSATSDSVPR